MGNEGQAWKCSPLNEVWTVSSDRTHNSRAIFSNAEGWPTTYTMNSGSIHKKVVVIDNSANPARKETQLIGYAGISKPADLYADGYWGFISLEKRYNWQGKVAVDENQCDSIQLPYSSGQNTIRTISESESSCFADYIKGIAIAIFDNVIGSCDGTHPAHSVAVGDKAAPPTIMSFNLDNLRGDFTDNLIPLSHGFSNSLDCTGNIFCSKN